VVGALNLQVMEFEEDDRAERQAAQAYQNLHQQIYIGHNVHSLRIVVCSQTYDGLPTIRTAR